MKKLLNFILIFLLTITIFTNKVYAEDITINKVISKFQEYLNESSSENNATVKLEDNKIVVYSDDEKFIEYNYENNVISHTMTLEIEDPDSMEGFEETMKAVLIELNNLSLLNTIASLHGYSERDIRLFSSSDDLMANSNFDENGYLFSVNEESENKGTIEFKVDIQKFKLVTNYNNAKAPELKFSDIEENEIGIQAYADLEDAKQNNAVDEEDTVMVEVYRSVDGENFYYLYSISASTSDDMGVITYKDTLLEPGTTYYYKAVVDHSNNFSQVYEVKTTGEKKVNNTINLDITKEGIVINVKTNLEAGKLVKIYKSENNKDFELLQEVSVLNNEISYLDKSVENNKTYYYKVDLGNDDILVSSLKYEKNSKDETTENPQTGVYNNLIYSIVIIIISLGGLKLLNKKSKLNKI